ncbi:hypothetical protein F5B18DRAFT_401125 [Nemania serpens]|nr:hypothetical protein F5B18DRAFT_401125 [Nemania serpens]
MFMPDFPFLFPFCCVMLCFLELLRRCDMIPHQLFGYAVYSENCFVAKEISLAGESAVAPSPGTACCSRDETGDNAFCAIVRELVSWAFTHVAIEKIFRSLNVQATICLEWRKGMKARSRMSHLNPS